MDTNHRAEDPKKSGADIPKTGCSELPVVGGAIDPAIDDLPSALESLLEIGRRLEGKRVALFLDYDGTLTPIVKRPELAVLSEAMRSTLQALTDRCTVAVISGRDLTDVRDRVGLEHLIYAGSHGFEIAGPKGRRMGNEIGTDFLHVLDKAESALNAGLSRIKGARIERKKLSIAVHYREVNEDRVQAVERIVNQILEDHPGLSKSHGKKVFELQPQTDWHKGKAVHWLLEVLGLDEPEVMPLCIGDDLTDEDAFRALGDRGISIVVGEGSRDTAAQYALKDPSEVRGFLRALTDWLPESEA